MATPSSLTLNYNAVLSSTLFNYRKKLEDCISSSNAFLYKLMKTDGGYVGLSDVGERAAIPLMYEVGSADSYEGYDVLSVDPMDGISTAFYDWRQAAIPISISGKEELINSGETKLFSLIQAKTKQAEIGIKEFFARALLQGDGTLIAPYTSASNGSTFVEPIGKLIDMDPDRNVAVGNINKLSYSWWRNQSKASAGASYAAIFADIDNLYNTCSQKAGGPPNLFLADQNVYELYCKMLRTFHHNPSYKDADMPFENVLLKGKPLVFDEYVGNAEDGNTTLVTTKGTLYMINTQFFQVQYHKSRNFAPTNMQKPENQDAKCSHLLWFGAVLCSNLRKQGVLYSIDTTVAA